MQCLSVDQHRKGQLAEMPAILDSFYTSIRNNCVRVVGNHEVVDFSMHTS